MKKSPKRRKEEANKKSKSVSYFWLVGLFGILFLSAYLQRNDGGNHFEHLVTMHGFLQDRSLLNTIFDIEQTEGSSRADNFQARELSYLTDYMDVQFIFFLATHRLSAWLSITKYLFMALMVIISWFIFTKVWRMNPFVCFLFIAMLLTSPAFFWHGYFHHTAKIGCAFFILLSFFLMDYEPILQKDRRGILLRCALFSSLLCCELYDPQGAFVVLSTTAFLLFGVAFDSNRRKRFVTFLLPAAAAFLLYVFYYKVLGPWLIYQLNGYSPGFETDKVKPLQLLRLALPRFLGGARLILDHVRFFLGSLEPYVSAILVSALFYVAWLTRKVGQRQDETAGIFVYYLPFLFAFTIISAVLVQEMMSLRMSSIMEPTYRRIYYPIPIIVIAFFGVSRMTSELLKARPKLRNFFGIALLFLVIHNVFMLDDTKELLDEQRWDGRSAIVEKRMRLFRSLRSPCEDVSAQLQDDPIGLVFEEAMRNQDRCKNNLGLN